MTRYLLALAAFALATAGFVATRAVAQTPPPSVPAATGAAPSCKTFGAGRCCAPAVTAHLSKEAVFGACGESEATFLGEQGGKDSCKYFFKVAGQKDEEMYVEVFAPAAKDVPPEPTDPFFKWGMVGPVFYTEKALSPKSQPMLAHSTGLWLPGKGYFVAVNASTGVCTKAQAKRLAPRMK
jgi:hypothetical protein